ncbi:MAG: Enoyl-CoA hydratase/isomerase [Promethearchaeota archaeon CR_4]|nr:MAG: Enoyl-CoA hydratase/isomerase [Candidatus Lokiarchaeota archaeon CR_4]
MERTPISIVSGVMSYQTIIYQKESDLGRITLNRPQAMNAITPDMLKELKDAVLEAGNDKDVKVIVITGAGKAFCAGVDLKSLGDRKLVNGRVGDILDLPGQELIKAIRTVPKVVIALVNGFCFTGALELMLWCDLAIAAEEAKIGDTHAKWGIRPSWGRSARLPHRVGYLKAKELSFTADFITGKEAERIGLVNLAVPAAKLNEALVTMVKKITANSSQVVAAYKYIYNTNENMTPEKCFEFELKSDFEITDTDERLGQFRK